MDASARLEALKGLIPEPAKDLRLNLAAVLKPESLTPAQALGCALASAIASRNRLLVAAIRPLAAGQLDATGLAAVESAAAVMSMNNIYYRFTHLVSDKEFASMPARLRMQAMASHGADPLAFELWSIAVSAVNGCGKCLDAHVAKSLGGGGTRAMVQDAVRIASVVYGVATMIDASSGGAAGLDL